MKASRKVVTCTIQALASRGQKTEGKFCSTAGKLGPGDAARTL